uniref:Scol-pM12A n=1 Tax=Scolopendra viridis TaxID=118503 RepID=A0A4D5RA18_SCOVI
MGFFYSYTLLCLIGFILLTDASKENQCPERQIKTSDITIQSPLYPNFPLNFRCWYNISAPPNHMIVVSFSKFDFPEKMRHSKANYGPILEDCATDYLQLWKPDLGDKSNKFCGKELEGLNLVTKESMNLVFQSFDAVGVEGFEAKIKFVPISGHSNCTTSFIDEETEFVLPSWGTERCTLNVKAPVGKVPILQLSKVSDGGNGVMHTTVISNDYKYIPRTESYSQLCEGEIKGKSFNTNFAQFKLQPKQGTTNCRVKVKFVDPYLLCGGVKEIAETAKHDIFDFDFTASDLCIWTVVMKNTVAGLDVTAAVSLKEATNKGVCDKDHVMGYVKENEKVTSILPMTCGETDGFYIEVPKVSTKRDLEVTIMVYAPFLFRAGGDLLGNFQYFPSMR